MRTKQILAAALAVFTVLTLAVSSASADGGGGDPCKKRPCPPPPCKVDCPNPEPTNPPPAPEPDTDCELVEGFHIGRRHAGESRFIRVTVNIHETTQGSPGFAIEYRSFRHDGERKAIDGGLVDFDFTDTYRVRQWRYVTGGVYVIVDTCDHQNVSVTFAA